MSESGFVLSKGVDHHYGDAYLNEVMNSNLSIAQ